MKEELKTTEVIDKLTALREHYLAESKESKKKKAMLSAVKHAQYATAIAAAIHEIELMSGVID